MTSGQRAASNFSETLFSVCKRSLKVGSAQKASAYFMFRTLECILRIYEIQTYVIQNTHAYIHVFVYVCIIYIYMYTYIYMYNLFRELREAGRAVGSGLGPFQWAVSSKGPGMFPVKGLGCFQ